MRRPQDERGASCANSAGVETPPRYERRPSIRDIWSLLRSDTTLLTVPPWSGSRPAVTGSRFHMWLFDTLSSTQTSREGRQVRGLCVFVYGVNCPFNKGENKKLDFRPSSLMGVPVLVCAVLRSLAVVKVGVRSLHRLWMPLLWCVCVLRLARHFGAANTTNGSLTRSRGTGGPPNTDAFQLACCSARQNILIRVLPGLAV